jgi:hypothetical protein
MNTISKSWVLAAPAALFVASAVGTTEALVVTAAGGVDGVGAVAFVALFIPGSLLGTIAVMPQESS